MRDFPPRCRRVPAKRSRRCRGTRWAHCLPTLERPSHLRHPGPLGNMFSPALRGVLHPCRWGTQRPRPPKNGASACHFFYTSLAGRVFRVRLMLPRRRQEKFSPRCGGTLCASDAPTTSCMWSPRHCRGYCHPASLGYKLPISAHRQLSEMFFVRLRTRPQLAVGMYCDITPPTLSGYTTCRELTPEFRGLCCLLYV